MSLEPRGLAMRISRRNLPRAGKVNRADLVRGIAKAWAFAKRLKLDETFANPVPLEPRDEYRRMALDENTHYEDVYLTALKGSYYNFLLCDFSFFQFHINGDGETRFAYYPNPFIGASISAMAELTEMREYLEEDVITTEEYLHAVAERRACRHPPLIRYEHAPSQYKELSHPCSHFHFGNHGENRWAVKRELTPVAFSLLIYRQFYGLQWQDCGEGVAEIPSLDSCLRDERQNSRTLSDAQFTEEEARHFHFA